jgi:hypothetical protein
MRPFLIYAIKASRLTRLHRVPLAVSRYSLTCAFGASIFFENLRGPEVENADGITKWVCHGNTRARHVLAAGNLVDNLK